MQELKIKIEKMTCVNCANSIEKISKKIEGIKDASISYVNSSGVFLIENEKVKNELFKKIKNLGYEILDEEQDLEKYKLKQFSKMKLNFFLSAILSILIMYFEMFVKNSFSKDMQLLISIFAIFYCGRVFFINAIKGLKYKNLDMNTLVALGSFMAFVYSLLVYFKIFEKDEHLYFSGASMIISFVLFGKLLEEYVKFKAQDYQKKINSLSIKKAKILINDELKEIPSSFVKVDDILIVKEGESIVADGVVIEGKAELDTSFLTGEFLPVLKQKDSIVSAGSIVLNGFLKIRVSKKAMDSTLEQIKDLIFKAGNIKTPIATLVDKISAYFVGFIIIIASIVFIFWSLKSGFNEAFLYGCAVILISCPCALGLATPIAIVVALANAAKKSILIKNPSALENLNQIKEIVFDKTGTLTEDKLKIYKHNLSEENFNLLAQIESFSSHPIAKAISKNLNLNTCLKGEVKMHIGKGLEYQGEDAIYFAGNEEFLQEKGVDISKTKEFFEKFLDKAPVYVYFAKDKECLGGVCLSNTLKQEAKELILSLKQKKIHSIILSGDNEKSVKQIAKELSIDEFYASLKPDEKLNFIQKKQNKNPIVFVGDGINDAPSLNLADIGISFAKANDLAKESGDFILIKDDLGLIDYCFKISHKTRNIIKLNLFWAFFYNSLCIPIAAGFVPYITLNPHLAALAMCFSSIAVVLNSLRLKNI
ncbi:cation-translocating P-type ATPase [Campylobacter sp. TTU-622]|uniref:heavy metal translocating P-type ATPase n=1 Tax=Campylobacter sp. TTU-622 TaxID=2800583 RepID=UPI0019041CB0|nr:cation-translocating P-type ATPase [Campylobacter sp. TTU-622]MBK1972661.1 cation-translocating P-type ATPase [Campylobacter sp. TTU-622]